MHILDTITSHLRQKIKRNTNCSPYIFFNQVLVFTIMRRHQLFLSKTFKVKATIERPLR